MEEIKDIAQQVAPETAAQDTPVPAPASVPEQKESKHFYNLRAEKARIERERDEALRKVQEYEARFAPAQAPQEDDEIRLDPDALAEGKHLAKLVKQVKKLDAQRVEDQKRYAAMIAETKLRAQYADFDEIVNTENISLLKTMEPEVAASLSESTNVYAQAVATYKAIKNFGIHTQDPYKDAKERVQANAAKPKAEASVPPLQGSTALGAAQDFSGPLSDDMKRKLFAEMNEYRRGY